MNSPWSKIFEASFHKIMWCNSGEIIFSKVNFLQKKFNFYFRTQKNLNIINIFSWNLFNHILWSIFFYWESSLPSFYFLLLSWNICSWFCRSFIKMFFFLEIFQKEALQQWKSILSSTPHNICRFCRNFP